MNYENAVIGDLCEPVKRKDVNVFGKVSEKHHHWLQNICEQKVKLPTLCKRRHQLHANAAFFDHSVKKFLPFSDPLRYHSSHGNRPIHQPKEWKIF